MLRAQLVLLPGLSKACATHEASAGFGAARLRAMRNPSASAAPDVERVQSVEMDVLSGDGTVAIDEFVRARAETIRYHETLYRSTSLGTRGSWLAHPHPLVMDSLGLVTHPVHAYDLGAGVGRHTLPIVAGLPTGSRVTAVDIIPSALASLVENTAAAGLSNCVETVNADLESWAFPADDAGLIVAFSALEHVSSLDAYCAILERCRGATIPGGVNVIGIVADREEVSSSGARRAALIEIPQWRASSQCPPPVFHRLGDPCRRNKPSRRY